MKLHAEFEMNGVKAAYVDASTPRDERAAIIKRLENRDLEIICSIGTMTMGVDIPCVSCISYVRPTKSEMLLVQSLGRGLRIDPENPSKDLLILDHSDSTMRLGLLDTIHHDELLTGEKGAKSKNANEDKPEPKECPACKVLIPLRSRTCPACGCSLMSESKVVNAPGVLHEVMTGDRAATRANREWPMASKAQFFAELLHYGEARGHKQGWAAFKYREKFGVWPNSPEIRYATPRPPSTATLAWIKSRNIAFAKARGA
jgi:superfamily II DNA or RNA helicase